MCFPLDVFELTLCNIKEQWKILIIESSLIQRLKKVFGYRYWMPTNSGIMSLLLVITICAVLHKSCKTSENIHVGILLFNTLLILKLPFLSILIMLCGDVEINPGPKANFQQRFCVGYWNLKSIFAHNFAKIIFLEAYAAVRKFDIIYLSESWLKYTR